MKIENPIIKTTDLSELKTSDLTSNHSNIFDNFQNKSSVNFDNAYNITWKILNNFPAFSEFIDKNKKNYKNFEVIFPNGVLDKIKNGKYFLTKSKGTEDFLAIVKNKKDNTIVKQLRLRDISDTDKLNNLLPSLQNMAVINSINKLSMQLENIEEKLVEIQKEFNTDRIGEIKSGYSLFLNAIQAEDSTIKKDLLISAQKSLSDGRSKLIESSKNRVKNISVGFWKSLFKELFSINNVKNQEANVKEFIKEFFYIQRASQIILMIYQELNESQSMIQSLAPFKDFMVFLNSDDVAYNINEWEASKKDWKKMTTNSLQAINNIPEFRTSLRTEDITLNLKQNE